MIQYVAGFAFNAKETHVVLIKKQRPVWQAGKLNGPGGHCEIVDGRPEEPSVAMDREFCEECGVSGLSWALFATMRGKDIRGKQPLDDWTVSFFYAKDDRIFKATAKTSEEVIIYKLESWGTAPVLPNLRWLIPMALSFGRGEVCQSFLVDEVYSAEQLSGG